ncbi:hypothetical protein DUI87_18246 [Hirundo rustica rustica]|uniref:RNA-directed DNA polymerase from mobile element jockey n=1 Tax=Hirundo rustica rustica TaxID=333673 RepID=A0A3M0JWF0_HIRRU|nr:hypothetical protein DUI87_18246 [Hirundo rustica rustica]
MQNNSSLSMAERHLSIGRDGIVPCQAAYSSKYGITDPPEYAQLEGIYKDHQSELLILQSHTICPRVLSNASGSLSGWCCDHFSGEPVPVPSHPLGKETFSYIQTKPFLTKLQAIPLGPVTGHQTEEKSRIIQLGKNGDWMSLSEDTLKAQLCRKPPKPMKKKEEEGEEERQRQYPKSSILTHYYYTLKPQILIFSQNTTCLQDNCSLELVDGIREQNGPPIIQEEAVRELLRRLDTHKSMGLEGIHPRVMRELADELAKPLSIIYQQSWLTGEVPDEWKLASVTPIHKKGGREDPSNYRPISMTSVPGKYLARTVYTECHHIEFTGWPGSQAQPAGV